MWSGGPGRPARGRRCSCQLFCFVSPQSLPPGGRSADMCHVGVGFVVDGHGHPAKWEERGRVAYSIGHRAEECVLLSTRTGKPQTLSPHNHCLPSALDPRLHPAGAVAIQGWWFTLGWVTRPTEETGPLACLLQDGKPVLQLHVQRGPTPAEAHPRAGLAPKPLRLANGRPRVCELGPQDGVCEPGRAR